MHKFVTVLFNGIEVTTVHNGKTFMKSFRLHHDNVINALKIANLPFNMGFAVQTIDNNVLTGLFDGRAERLKTTNEYTVEVWIGGFEKVIKKICANNEEEVYEIVTNMIGRDEIDELTWIEIIEVLSVK